MYYLTWAPANAEYQSGTNILFALNLKSNSDKTK